MPQRIRSFDLLRQETAGGILLFASAALAMVVANSTAAPLYQHVLDYNLRLGTPAFGLSKTILHWINDGLMAIFFFLVGLEIKREFLKGALSSPRSAALPAIAALGGMIVPAAIYAAINWNNAEALRGAAIPAATDIAIAAGMLALLGRRIPAALKAFLLALAIIDDLGAIIIIAVFYASDLSAATLGLAALGVCGLLLLNLKRVTQIWPYALLGLFVWTCVLKSGVHATLAGVVTALTIPLMDSKAGPLERAEHTLNPWVSFGILPLFAFANAGLSLEGLSFGALIDPVTLGIVLGLFVGKPAGIFAFSKIAIARQIAELPVNTNDMQLFGASVLAGIGFTMSLFIGMLAFPEGTHDAQVRLGVIVGSILSGVTGYFILVRRQIS